MCVPQVPLGQRALLEPLLQLPDAVADVPDDLVLREVHAVHLRTAALQPASHQGLSRWSADWIVVSLGIVPLIFAYLIRQQEVDAIPPDPIRSGLQCEAGRVLLASSITTAWLAAGSPGGGVAQKRLQQRTDAAKKLTWITLRRSVGFMKNGGFSTTWQWAMPLCSSPTLGLRLHIH